MQKHLEAFWAEVVLGVKKNDSNKLHNILNGLKEPKETRLGFSNGGINGNNVGDVLKDKILDAITGNKAVLSGQLSKFCDVGLFIDDVSSDRASDIITKVTKRVLIKFTQDQCELYKIPMKTVTQKDIFDHKKCKWDKSSVELLPVCQKGIPIIFVPKNIVRNNGATNLDFMCFYRYAIKHFISKDKTMLEDVSKSGKDGEIYLKDVKQQYPPSKESMSNWINKYGKLLVDFKSEKLKDRITSLSDDEISKIIYSRKK